VVWLVTTPVFSNPATQGRLYNGDRHGSILAAGVACASHHEYHLPLESLSKPLSLSLIYYAAYHAKGALYSVSGEYPRGLHREMAPARTLVR